MVLEVGGAFHSPLMASARTGLEEYLAAQAFAAPTRPVIANVTAEPVTAPSDIAGLLVSQVTAPVRWAQTMAYLAAQGVTTVYEIGPGKVLSGLAKRDLKPETSVSLDTMADIEAYCAVRAQ